MADKERIKRIVLKFVRPLMVMLTGLAIAAFLVQLLYPNLYFGTQEDLRNWVSGYEPYDKPMFVALQVIQVILTPLSHYVVGIAGGAIYGVWEGFFLNYIGRVIGHVAAYFIAFYFGRRFISWLFDPEQLSSYQKFVNGTPKTMYLRALILFAILFLPLFPDDELSYFVGLAAFPFRIYLPILLLGHIGGSLGLAYIGAGVDTRDALFWVIFTAVLLLAALLVFSVRRLYAVKE